MEVTLTLPDLVDKDDVCPEVNVTVACFDLNYSVKYRPGGDQGALQGDKVDFSK